MFDNKNELEAREEILGMVDEYCKNSGLHQDVTQMSLKRSLANILM